MAIYDLYGIKAASLEGAKLIVEGILALPFEERDSGYHRGPYFACGQIGKENFEIKRNIDPFEEVPNEEDFTSEEFLLYINNTDRSTQLRSVLESSDGLVKLLRHEDI